MVDTMENQENQGFELELSEETITMLEDYAAKTGQSEDQIIEFIITEFLQKQLPVVQKMAEESGTSLNDLLNKQFARLLEMIVNRELK